MEASPSPPRRGRSVTKQKAAAAFDTEDRRGTFPTPPSEGLFISRERGACSKWVHVHERGERPSRRKLWQSVDRTEQQHTKKRCGGQGPPTNLTTLSERPFSRQARHPAPPAASRRVS